MCFSTSTSQDQKRQPDTPRADRHAIGRKERQSMDHQLDIVIPVYNEGPNILATLGALAREVKTPARVLICYDMGEDDTLAAVHSDPEAYAGLEVALSHLAPKVRDLKAQGGALGNAQTPM